MNFFFAHTGCSALSGRRRCHLFVAFPAVSVALDFADSSMPGALNFKFDLNHDVGLAKVASKIDELIDLRLAQSRPGPAALSLEEH